MRKFLHNILLNAGIDSSQSQKGHITDLMGQFQRRVEFYAESSLEGRLLDRKY